MIRSRSLVLSLLALSLPLLVRGGGAIAAEPAAPVAASRGPRAIVLVTVDTLRADRVSFGGYGRPTTPFLDRLAKEGAVFESAYATSSWTPPTMASIFTGVAPMTHGVVAGEVREAHVLQQPVLPESLVTLAELAHERGYRTLGVPSNKHLLSEFGFAQGFDRYRDPDTFLAGVAVNQGMRDLLEQELGPEWRRRWRERPLFLWLHYFDPHDPYIPYEPWMKAQAPGAPDRGQASPARKVMRQLRELFPHPDAALAEAIRPFYDSEIRRMNDDLETLWNELAPDDDVLFVLTADHGEEMADHGQLGHAQSLYEELVRVPLLLRWPRAIPGGTRIRQPVSLIDLLPTLYDLLGAAAPESLPGRSLVPFLRPASGATTGSAPPSRPVFLELAPPRPFRWAVVEGDLKLIVDPTASGQAELYDLARDPGERTNVAGQRPAEVERLRQLLRSWARRQPRAPDQQVRDRVDEKLVEELEALGYLGGAAPAPAAPEAPPPAASEKPPAATDPP